VPKFTRSFWHGVAPLLEAPAVCKGRLPSRSSSEPVNQSGKTNWIAASHFVVRALNRPDCVPFVA